jgi:Tol biopolymer transport system component
MKYLLLVVLLFMAVPTLLANDHAEAGGYVRSPMNVLNGIVFSDNYGSALYLRADDGTVRRLTTAPGAGTYFSVSPDRRTIGFKLIDENGLQAPAVVDAVSGTVRILAAPSKLAGQVSFLADGRCAYTLGTSLILSDGTVQTRYDLGAYANLAPVSPDGRSAAFNDAHDQLCVIDLTSLDIRHITSDTRGYFNPQWSADGGKILYSSLNGFLFVYDRSTAITSALGEGYAPVWSADGRNIAFYKKEIQGDSLINSDIFVASADGKSVRQVTFTPDVCEMDPSFTASDASIMFQTYARSEIGIMPLPSTNEKQTVQSLPTVIPIQIHPILSAVRPTTPAVRTIDVPYVNQVYDTPDWFNGRSACGPTTSVMALAYYNILPLWPTSCATPTRHINNWGSYVSEIYTYRAITYAASADDPNGRPAQGAFGYMWSTGSPNSRMSGYYTNHGLQSSTYDSPANSAAVAELSGGNFYSICNGLTTAGHIVLAHDVDPSDPHVIIVNDPYGDKNKPDYPNYFGKDAKYDWPGYNFGHQNFNTVYWAATSRYTPPAPADSTVDDMQIDNGFYLHTKSPASMSMWKFKAIGYKNHFWYLFTTASTDVDTCYGIWTPNLDKAGRYEVFVYLPHFSALYSPVALYKVATKDGLHTIQINQQAINLASTQDTLISLGTFDFDNGSTGNVRLGDGTGHKNDVVVLDAMMWKYRGASVTSVASAHGTPHTFAVLQNYPNPFNPSTKITFLLAESSRVQLTVFDVLGREVARLADGEFGAGVHTFNWDAGTVAGGMYFYRLTAEGPAGRFSEVKNMVSVK